MRKRLTELAIKSFDILHLLKGYNSLIGEKVYNMGDCFILVYNDIIYAECLNVSACVKKFIHDYIIENCDFHFKSHAIEYIKIAGTYIIVGEVEYRVVTEIEFLTGLEGALN